MKSADFIANRLDVSRTDIDKAEDDDPLVITPYDKGDIASLRKSGAGSVDLRLGTWFVKLREGQMAYLPTNLERKKRGGVALVETHYVGLDGEYYVHPGSFILGITLEWLRLPSNLAGYVIGKSSWGRRGLIIATATGVHPGFTGCLTLEITNVGQTPISVRPGWQICQLFIHEVEPRAKRVQTSQFGFQRKPIIGDVVPDPKAKRLFRARRRALG